MKKLIFMMLVLLVPIGGMAEVKQFVVFDDATGTLTFAYEDLDSEKLAAGEYGNHVALGWSSSFFVFSPISIEFKLTEVTKVVFRSQCANVKHTNFTRFFHGMTNLTEVEGIEYLNTSNALYMNEMFRGCSKLTSLDVSNFNTSKVTNMGQMFEGCSSLTSLDVSKFNTSKVTNMNLMFYGCSLLTDLDVSGFDTSNVTLMSGMFRDCSKLTSLDVSKFNTSNVTRMGSMFSGCSLLTSLDVSQFDTSKVTDMGAMFRDCSKLTSLDVSKFNTSNVTEMDYMFSGCSLLTSLDVSKFNTSNVTEMDYMFSGCSLLTSLDVTNFNTSNVTDMSHMFSSCSKLTSLDVTNFNTSNATDMRFMFFKCSSLTSLDVSNFNTSNVTNMVGMFEICSSLTSLDLSNFDTSNVTDMMYMFEDCKNLKTIYCNDTWATGHDYMFDGCTSLVGENGKTYNGATISSDYAHPNAGGYFTKKHEAFTTVTIGTETQYWSSYFTTTRNVVADENITVYTATLSGDKKSVTLNEIADKTIPCGQAVLMKSTINNPILLTATSEGAGDYSTNSLKGTQTAIATSSVEGKVYTLASKDGKFGFYKYSGTELNGGKAYLAVPNGALARIAIAGLDGEATGIEGIATDEEQEPCYDLQGRCVNPTRKGIYVINGKKVVK